MRRVAKPALWERTDMQRKYQKKFDANTKRTRWQITLIKSDRVQAAGGSLAYIRAPNQTLAFKFACKEPTQQNLECDPLV